MDNSKYLLSIGHFLNHCDKFYTYLHCELDSCVYSRTYYKLSMMIFMDIDSFDLFNLFNFGLTDACCSCTSYATDEIVRFVRFILLHYNNIIKVTINYYYLHHKQINSLFTPSYKIIEIQYVVWLQL